MVLSQLEGHASLASKGRPHQRQAEGDVLSQGTLGAGPGCPSTGPFTYDICQQLVVTCGLVWTICLPLPTPVQILLCVLRPVSARRSTASNCISPGNYSNCWYVHPIFSVVQLQQVKATNSLCNSFAHKHTVYHGHSAL